LDAIEIIKDIAIFGGGAHLHHRQVICGQ